jgi:hypothetical protein
VVDDMDGAAEAHQQVGSAERVGDARKGDALLEVKLGPGRQERIHVGVYWRQGIIDVVARDRVVFDGFAGEAIEVLELINEKDHRGVERRAALRICGRFAQMLRHLLDQADRGRAV